MSVSRIGRPDYKIALVKIDRIIDGIDRYDDFVDCQSAHGLWVEKLEDALDQCTEIIEGVLE